MQAVQKEVVPAQAGKAENVPAVQDAAVECGQEGQGIEMIRNAGLSWKGLAEHAEDVIPRAKLRIKLLREAARIFRQNSENGSPFPYGVAHGKLINDKVRELWPEKCCPGCRNPFTPKRPNQIYCTFACGDRTRHRRANSPKKASVKR